MKKYRTLLYSTILLATGTATCLYAAPPQGYYDSLEGKSGVELKKATKAVAKDHNVIDYGENTWTVFEKSDTRLLNGEPIWWDMYSSDRIKVSTGHSALNIEHSVANSWWGGIKNDAYKDLLHLNPSNADANNRKSNYPLGEISSVTWDNGVTFIGVPTPETGGGSSRVYEPVDYYKGDFARTFFYIFTVYDDIPWEEDKNWMYDTSSELLLRPWAYRMLLRWAAADPVSKKEYDRNETIYKYQRNRNPFIDCPELAEHIWGSKSDVGFTYAGDFTPAPDPDLGDDEYDDTPRLEGFWKAVVSDDDLEEGAKYCLVETSAFHAMSYNYDSKNKYMIQSDILPDICLKSEPWTINGAPEDMAIVTLTPTWEGYALGISSAEDQFFGYLKSTTSKSVTLSNNPTDTGCGVTITPKADNTVISFGSAVGRLQYNKQSPRFNTYTSSQQDVMLFKLIEEDEYLEIMAGVDEIESEGDLNEIVAIYDINGRRVDANDVEALAKGIYILVTPAGTTKLIK